MSWHTHHHHQSKTQPFYSHHTNIMPAISLKVATTYPYTDRLPRLHLHAKPHNKSHHLATVPKPAAAQSVEHGRVWVRAHTRK